ncbi:MAG: AAA family ATPase [Caldilineaceae bacterium]|nr:AAA family ATPase [Caldilineaceae bacterium]
MSVQSKELCFDGPVLWALMPQYIPGKVVEIWNDPSKGKIQPLIPIFYPNGAIVDEVFSRQLQGFGKGQEVLFSWKNAPENERKKQAERTGHAQPNLIQADAVKAVLPEEIDQSIQRYEAILAEALQRELRQKIDAYERRIDEINAEIERRLGEAFVTERLRLAEEESKQDTRNAQLDHLEATIEQVIEERTATEIAKRNLELDLREEKVHLQEKKVRDGEDQLHSAQADVKAERKLLAEQWALFEAEGGRAYLEYANLVAGKEESPIEKLERNQFVAPKWDSLAREMRLAGYEIEEDLLAMVVTTALAAWSSGQFVILAGPTGVGKTQLVRRLADLLHAGYGDVAVRPSWTDPTDLFGYYNAMSEIFEPTPFLHQLTKAKRKAEENRLYLLCLDEMNLGRIENYAADLLSRYERIAAGDSRQAGLDLYSEDVADRLKKEELALCRANGELTPKEQARKEILTRQLMKYPARLDFPRSLLLFGTVNVDETTHLFSPKFLDRAYVLRFPPIDLNSERKNLTGTTTVSEEKWPFPLNWIDELGRPGAKPRDFDTHWQQCVDWQPMLRQMGVYLGHRFLAGYERYLTIGSKLSIPTGKLADGYFVSKLLPRIRFDMDEAVENGGNGRKIEVFDRWLQMLAEGDKYPLLCRIGRGMRERSNRRGIVEFWD